MSAAMDASRGRAIEARRARAALTLVRVAVAMILVGLVLGAMLAWITSDLDQHQLATAWLRHETYIRLNPIGIFKTQQQGLMASAIFAPQHDAAMRMLHRMLIAGAAIAVPLSVAVTWAMGRHWTAVARASALDEVKRGNRIATAAELARLVMKTKPEAPFITIGGVPIPPQDERRGLLVVGSTGSGKTTMLHTHVGQIDERGQHAIIFDPDGSYIEHFYRPERGDVILNLWDARTARWNPLADITGLADAYRVAAVLLPKPSKASENAIWYDQARTVVAHIIDHLASTGAGLDDLAAMFNTAAADDLRTIMASTPAARVFEAGGERATASVLFMTGVAARTVALLATVPDRAPAFSFDGFYAALAEHAGPKPIIFLAAPRRYREAGAPVIAAWIDAAASAILQRDPRDAPPAWLILDELPSLPAVQSLLTLLPEGRKHNARVTIAFQSFQQMRERYGPEGAEIVTGQTASQVIMAAGDAATAKWAVDLIGTVEAESHRASETLGYKDGGSLALHRERKSLVIDAEVTGLKVGEAFLRLSGFPIARITIAPPKTKPLVAPAFVPAATPPRIPVTPTPPPSRIEDREDWLSIGEPF